MNTEMGNQKSLLITIDGPAGAGKTTVSRMLASHLDFLYVDTGALYRGVAFEVFSREIDPENDRELEKIVPDLNLQFEYSNKGTRLVLKGDDITDRIRTPEITMLASKVSASPIIRNALLDVQKQMGARKSAVFEGRDMGTVVFPDADVKFFLTADVKARAMRRFTEYGDGGKQCFDEVLEDMLKRDADDSSRAIAPLRPADDAIIIDSSGLSPDSVVEKMVEHINSARPKTRILGQDQGRRKF